MYTNHEIIEQSTVQPWLLCLVLLLIIVPIIAKIAESKTTRDLIDSFMRLPFWRKMGIIALAIVLPLWGMDKPPQELRKFWRLMLLQADYIWDVQVQADKIDKAEADAADAAETMLDVPEEIEHPSYISFDWHAPNRLADEPGAAWHERQNILAWTCQVVPTNINGVLHEDHYVAFSGIASEEPAVINIEYACNLGDGTIIRETSATITNSYPDTVTVSLQSGDYECYWFRCIVPERFANNGYIRDWNGEALFGSPAGSGKGFDLAGIIVIDDNNGIWAGKSGDFDLGGGEVHTFTNGINVTEMLTGDDGELEEM